MSYINAELTFVSKGPIKAVPQVFTVGGFELQMPNSQSFILDWCQLNANTQLLPDGRMQFNVLLRDFDYEYFKDTNPTVDAELLTPEFLTRCLLKEVYYECFEGIDENECAFLELTDFTVFNEVHVAEFEKAELVRYEQEEAYKVRA